jgi:nicotinamidase/pyrazinamidase
MKTLVIVDVQNDFCPGGALPVKEGDLVVAAINRLQLCFDLVAATQDWHPADHGSFAANHPGKEPGERIELAGLEQILWPVHCVEGSHGAEFHPGLDRSRVARVFRKGTDREIDSYGGFFDNGHRKATGLGDYLKRRGVTRVFLAGLATDYCVKFTALDAVELGFETTVIQDACRGVDLQPGDVDRALAEMRAKGVRVVTASQVVEERGSSHGDPLPPENRF